MVPNCRLFSWTFETHVDPGSYRNGKFRGQSKVWNLKSVPALLLAAKWSVAKCILLTNWKTFMLHTLQFSQLACLTLMNYFSNNIKWSDKVILRIKKKKRILMPCHANKTVTNCVLIVHGTCFYITVFDHCTFFVSCNSVFFWTRNNAPSLILDLSLSFWHMYLIPGLQGYIPCLNLYFCIHQVCSTNDLDWL